MKGRLSSLVLAMTIAACGPSAGDPTIATPSTTTPATTTTVHGVPLEITFDPVDRGVLTDIRFGEQVDLDPAPLDSDGDQILFSHCRTTWFGQYEFEFEWTPGNMEDATTTRVIALGLIVGDVGMSVGTVEVQLGQPGRFVVPISNFDMHRVEGETTGDTITLDQSSAISCLAVVAGPNPITGESRMHVPLLVEIKRPQPIHPADSIQGIVERIDPLDPDEPLRPLAALAGYLPQFPMDVVFVVPERVIESLTLEIEGTCIVLSALYRDGTNTNQHTGCLDGRHGGVSVDDVWNVEAQEHLIEELRPLSWWGHPGVEAVLDGNDYLDGRELPEGTTEIHRAEVAGVLVSVTRHLAEDGTVVFVMEGVGVNSGGGGFPGEVWNGCYQVQYQDAGFSMVLLADPSWTLSVDGRPIATTDAAGVGVALVASVISDPEQLDIKAPSGDTPRCLVGSS